MRPFGYAAGRLSRPQWLFKSGRSAYASAAACHALQEAVIQPQQAALHTLPAACSVTSRSLSLSPHQCMLPGSARGFKSTATGCCIGATAIEPLLAKAGPHFDVHSPTGRQTLLCERSHSSNSSVRALTASLSNGSPAEAVSPMKAVGGAVPHFSELTNADLEQFRRATAANGGTLGDGDGMITDESRLDKYNMCTPLQLPWLPCSHPVSCTDRKSVV